MARHTPPGDRSFQASLLQHAGAALALVLLVGAAFWGVGQVTTAGDGPDEEEIVAGESPGAAESPTADASPDGDGSPDDAATQTPTQTASPTPPASPTEAASPTETETETAPATTEDRIDPASISIQVLDAVLDDDGAAARSVADRLEAAGYRVVVVNQASRTYTETTVFWTSGNEPAARQVAGELGFPAADPQPGNLSESVTLHVVVGSDQA